MKINWNTPRKKEDLNIPEAYLKRDAQTQNRRELTFLLQEAAFSQRIPIYCTIDVEQLPKEQKKLFASEALEVKAAVMLGIPIAEMLLFMEQVVPELNGSRKESVAELKVKNYLFDFEEKLRVSGYQTECIWPTAYPDPRIATMLAASGKGFAGKNGRFITPDYGCRMCIGMVLTDAPLMGGDYRYQDYEGDGCGDCTLCQEICPAGALAGNRINKRQCMEYCSRMENQIEIAEYSRMRCMKCMEICPIGQDRI